MRHENDFLFNHKEEPSIGSMLWGATKLLTKATWCTTKFVAKNTPAAIGLAWEIRREISHGISEAIHETKQEQKRVALDKKILELMPPKKDVR